MNAGNDYREVNFEIVEEFGVLSTADTGWAKEFNLVSWNGAPPKYDIREWDPAHKRMSRGITLEEREMRQVIELLRKRRKNADRRRKFANGGVPPIMNNRDTDASQAAVASDQNETAASKMDDEVPEVLMETAEAISSEDGEASEETVSEASGQADNEYLSEAEELKVAEDKTDF